MKRPIRVLLLVLFATVIVLAAAACGDTGGEEENPQSGTGYTVTFDSNGGSAVAAVKVRDGKKIAEPAVPTKAGYAFVGWYKESGLNNLWDFSSDTVTGNITLYAKWEALSGEDPVDGTEYTVTFDSNGGSAVTAVKVTPSKKITEPTAPTKTGYTFGGWCKESGLNNFWDFSSDTVTGNITLYAKWEELPGTEGLTYAFNSGNASYSVTGYTGNTKDIIIPATYNGLPVTSIASSAFQWKSNITSVVIPSGVTSIGDGAFQSCSSLVSIEIPAGVTSIGNSAFSGCSSLVSIEIPAGVTSIGDSAFYYCYSLVIYARAASKPSGWNSSWNPHSCPVYWGINESNYYEDGEGVKYVIVEGSAILTRAPIRAGSITIASSITIGSSVYSVTSIGGSAFSSCDSLVIYARAASKPNGWDSSWNSSRPVYWGISESNYYEDGEGVKYVIVEGSAILTRAPISAESVTIASSITIGSSVYSVTSIGGYAFSRCSSLASIEIPASVTSIGDRAFSDCDSLVSIEIPASVASIGLGAFASCSVLSSVVFVAGSKLESIGSGAFRECYSLADIEIPTGVTSIGSSAFLGCSRLASIEIPTGVTSIGYSAFEYCDSLASIEIPAGVTGIGSDAFYDCYSLTIYARAVSKPRGWASNWNDSSRPVYWGINESNYYEDGEGVQYVIVEGSAILTRAPISAESVTIASSITIGSSVYSVTSIGRYAFSYCDSLANIEIPAGVTSIERYAFAYCRALKSVTMNSVTPPSLGILAFYNTPDDMKIYVPSGSEDTYKSASVWSGYSDRITAKA